jgi:SAM-dependent methyltransferase
MRHWNIMLRGRTEPSDIRNSLVSSSELGAELERIYRARFSGREAYRAQVWRILATRFFSQWLKGSDAVLDLGCGYGEFINNVSAAERFGMDLNPAARDRLDPGVTLLQQDCSTPWGLPDRSLDVVFTSNFFEHLPSKHALQATLLEAHRCLRPGGRLIAMGPNVKFLSGKYWDFFDHLLPLTDLSLSEVLLMTGYQVERTIPKFLPYSMSQGFQPPLWTLRMYLRIPALWDMFGRQFLVVGRKNEPVA